MRSLFVLLCLVTTTIISSQNRYNLSGGVEAPLIYSGAIGIGISIPLDKKIDPLTLPQLMDLDPLSINGFDRVATTTFGRRAQKASDVFLFTSPVLPMTLLLDEGSRNEFGTISTMYFETALVNYGITELVKVLAKRTRPYAYNRELSNDIKTNHDARKSFFSGHTSQVAASAFLTAKILSDQNPGGDLNPLYWATAATIPALTAYLRVKGGKHFPTDVIIGYAVGALVGILVPELHKL